MLAQKLPVLKHTGATTYIIYMVPKEEREFQPFKVSFATSLSYYLADMLFYPVDTVNTRFKANKYENPSLMKYLPHIAKTDGLMSLYKGASIAPLWTSFFPTLIYVSTYEILTKRINDAMNNKSPALMPFMIGCVAELASLGVLVPSDLIRMRIQSKQYSYKSFFSGMRQVIKKEGIMRLYKSSHLYMFYMSLQAGMFFQCYESFRDFYGHSVSASILNTAVSTVISTFICSPIDVLITRYAITDTSKKKRINFRQKVQKMWKREGIRGFFKGTVSRIVSTVGYNIFWMPIYEYFRSDFGSKM